MVDEHFTSSVELVWAKCWQAVAIARLNFKALMTEALSAEVLRDRYCGIIRLKDYHNRYFADKEWMKLSQTLKIISKCYNILVYAHLQ